MYRIWRFASTPSIILMDQKINYLAFNDVQDCFVCGLSNGLRVYNTDPLVEKANLDLKTTGNVALVAMLHRTNIIAIVPDGSFAPSHLNHKSGDNNRKLLFWDDAKRKFILEIEFESQIVAVKMSYSRLVVVLPKQINVFSFPGKLIKTGSLDTRYNPKGLCEMSSDPSLEYLAFPAHKVGAVQIMDLKQLTQSSSVSPITISAHQNEIACISMNRQGTILATASVKGTLIRLFDIQKKNLLAELRRGTDPAVVYCIKFSSDSAYLCASSDKGTIHVFCIKDFSLNRRSALQNIGVLGSYVDSQWALAKCAGLAECPCICGFGSSNQSVTAIYMDGTYHKFMFSKDGTCNREAFERFLNVTDDEEFWHSFKKT